MINNKYHILVIDDDNRLRNLLKQYLESNDFMVSVAEDTIQALTDKHIALVEKHLEAKEKEIMTV